MVMDSGREHREQFTLVLIWVGFGLVGRGFLLVVLAGTSGGAKTHNQLRHRTRGIHQENQKDEHKAHPQRQQINPFEEQ